MKAEPVAIPAGDGKVSGLLLAPAKARAIYVLAQGAGAGMEHPFMENAEIGRASCRERV